MPQSRKQWEHHMIKKYGSLEAAKEEMRRKRSLAENHGRGGWYWMKLNDPERFAQLQKKALESRKRNRGKG